MGEAGRTGNRLAVGELTPSYLNFQVSQGPSAVPNQDGGYPGCGAEVVGEMQFWILGVGTKGFQVLEMPGSSHWEFGAFLNCAGCPGLSAGCSQRWEAKLSSFLGSGPEASLLLLISLSLQPQPSVPDTCQGNVRLRESLGCSVGLEKCFLWLIRRRKTTNLC